MDFRNLCKFQTEICYKNNGLLSKKSIKYTSERPGKTFEFTFSLTIFYSFSWKEINILLCKKEPRIEKPKLNDDCRASQGFQIYQRGMTDQTKMILRSRTLLNAKNPVHLKYKQQIKQQLMLCKLKTYKERKDFLFNTLSYICRNQKITSEIRRNYYEKKDCRDFEN